MRGELDELWAVLGDDDDDEPELRRAIMLELMRDKQCVAAMDVVGERLAEAGAFDLNRPYAETVGMLDELVQTDKTLAAALETLQRAEKRLGIKPNTEEVT